MDIARIQREFVEAQRNFALVELRPTPDGKLFVKAAIQTSIGRQYVLSVQFPETYPYEMPRVFVDAPPLTDSPHRYKAGNICYLHPSMWNPGAHNLTFVIWRAAKWLNKYEVWRVKAYWPGAQIRH